MLIDTGDLLKFVQECPGGESFWVDFEGNFHASDMGYVIEFLGQFNAYANSMPRGAFYRKFETMLSNKKGD